MNYEYRIIKYEEGDEVFYCIEECMLDEDGVMGSHTIKRGKSNRVGHIGLGK